MRRIKNFKQDEKGSTLVEYSIAATVFIMAIFAVLELAAPSGRTTHLRMPLDAAHVMRASFTQWW